VKRSPFPLQWPEGLKRTRSRYSSAFAKGRGFNAARDGVLDELRLMGAAHVVITSNLPTNGRGLPHAVSAGRLEDPGISIWWVKDGKEKVMACDRWPTCVENMHALELTIKALRGILRWGSTEMVEMAFAGFAALPAAPSPLGKRPWREVLGDTSIENARIRYRMLIRDRHPDMGGSHEAAAELNLAMEQAEKELGG
jgi:hypothetical protein